MHERPDEIRVKAQRIVRWLAMAVMVSTRLWLGSSVSQHRDVGLIGEIVQLARETALTRPLLICVDGLRSYISAILTAFAGRCLSEPEVVAK